MSPAACVFELSPSERETYRRFASLALPRHTSYPIATAWSPAYTADEFERDLAEIDGDLSLYVHIPYCEKLCYYCACTKEIVPAAKRRLSDPAELLLEGLAIEAERVARSTSRRAGPIRQIHWGGGSPTFLRPKQIGRLWDIVADGFPIADDAEIAVEIDPRVAAREQLALLRRLGFNRVSLGIQDFDERVQHAVNRPQSFETVERVVGWCRELGFESMNFDMIYGLPFQSLDSMARTLERTTSLAPDRIAFYRLAVIPEIFRWQNVFRPEDLPAGELSLELNLLAIRHFLDAGYEFIGLDHFARQGELLTHAREQRTLHRNFQGMTTGKDLAILGLGPSAISQLDNAFAQNAKTTTAWREALAGSLATERGLRLSEDDRVRRELLQQLYSHGSIDKRSLEERFGIAFDEYFAEEVGRIDELSEERLVNHHEDAISLTPVLGRLLARAVAAAFDAYLPANAFREGLPAGASSKVG